MLFAGLVTFAAPISTLAGMVPGGAALAPGFMIASSPAGLDRGFGAGVDFCASVSGPVGGQTVQAYNLGPSIDNVFACGPTENTAWSNDPFETDFQCVEFSTRFMWAAYGLAAAPGNGNAFVANNHMKFPSIAVGTPSPGIIPSPGDVVSFSGGVANPNASAWGHTAVVSDVSHVNSATGDGYIAVVEENDGGSGSGRINVSKWSESMGNPQYAKGLYYYTDVSWLKLGVSVNVGASRTQIPNDGVSSTTVSAAVLAAQNMPLTNDHVSFTIFTRSGTCGTVSTPDAITDSLGRASTNYTASTANAMCTIMATEASTGQSGRVVVGQGVPGVYHSLVPYRIADTRTGSGLPLQGQSLGAGQSDKLPVAAIDGVPADATAAVFNVTATNPTTPSFLTVFADGTALPLASNLNFAAGETVANLVTVPLGVDGAVRIYNLAGTTDVVVDLEGFMQTGAGPFGLYNSLIPQRITDTRAGSGQPNSGSPVAAGGILEVNIDGAGGVPATGVSAVVLNVTATDATAASYLTAYPSGGARPLASNLNFQAGQVVPNRVIVPVPLNGRVSIYNLSGTVDIVVDVGGWFTDGTNPQASGYRFTPLTPTRVVDTRSASGQPLAGHTLGPDVADLASVGFAASLPADTVGVAANATVAGPTASSFLTIYPAGAARPNSSDLNWVAGEVASNMMVSGLGPEGSLMVYNRLGQADVIVDVCGYWS